MGTKLFTQTVLLAVLGLASSGCGETPRPLVDMEGVDPIKHNRDLADCYDRVAAQFISSGNAVGNCMASKGYKVLRKQ